MNILLLADLHGRIEGLEKLRRTVGAVDLVLLLGDITNFGDSASMGGILDHMAGWPLLGVAGNCDRPSAEQEMTRRGINLDASMVVRNGLRFTGAGRSLPCPGTTPNEVEESDFRRTLGMAEDDGTILPLVMVTHQSPRDTDADLAGTGHHVGSRSIREYIETHKPVLACCGHIHEARSVSTIGPTTVVNPGPWRDGFYATVELLPNREPVVTLRRE